MNSQPNWEGRTVARIRNSETSEVVGFVILTDDGSVARLWVHPIPKIITVEAVAGEDIKGLDLGF